MTDDKPMAEPLAADELNALAGRIVRGETYLRFIWDVEEIKTSWSMILMFAEEGFFTPERMECVGAFYSDMKEAFPTAINGLPLFGSVRFLHVDDIDPLIKRLDEIEEFMKPKEESNER
jgi:hypothetical protein